MDVSHQLSVLADKNIRYLVIHKSLAWRDRINDLKEWLAFDPMYSKELVVYRTAPVYGQDFSFIQEIDDGIGVIDSDFEAQNVEKGIKVLINVNWGSKRAPKHSYDVCFRLLDPFGQIIQTSCTSVCEDWPTSQWYANEVVRGRYKFFLDSDLPVGIYQIGLTLHNRDTGESLGVDYELGRINLADFQNSR